MKFNNIVHSLFSSISVLLTSFLTGVIIARGLDVVDRGNLAEYYLFVNIIIPFSLFGIYDVIIVNKSNDYFKLRSLAKSATIFLTIGCIAFVFFAIKKNYTTLLITTGLITIICNFIVVTNQAILARNEGIKKANTLRFIVPLIYFFCCLCFYYFLTIDVGKIVIFNAAANVFVALISIYMLSPIKSECSPKNYGFSYYYSKVSEIKWVALSTIFFSFSTKIDQLTISQLIGYEQLAYYAVALSSSVVVVNFFSTTILSVVYPKLSNLEHPEIILHGLVVFFITTIAYLLIVFFTYLIYPIIIPAFFGEKYEPAILLSQLMMINGGASYLKQLFNKKLKLLDKNKESFFSEILPSIIFVSLIVFLVYSSFSLTAINVVIVLIVSNMISLLYPVLTIVRVVIKSEVSLKDISIKKTWGIIR
tara:strand:- start:1196 stop:2455 length:1260 start_codon:yes stop_codon:yes gene_type:complete